MLRREVGAFHHMGFPAFFFFFLSSFIFTFFFFLQAFRVILQAKKIHSFSLQIVAIIMTVHGCTEILWKPDVTFSNLCCRGSGWPHKLYTTYI